MDLVTFQAALTGLKTAADIALGLSAIKTTAEVQAKAIELQQIILSAQSSAFVAQGQQMELIQKIADLEKQLAAVKAWDETRQRYELQEPYPGTYAYRLKAESGTAEPTHWICAHCFEDGRKAILQLQSPGLDTDLYACSACGSKFRFKGTKKPAPPLPPIPSHSPWAT